jgi:hypothetical protein
MPAQEPKLWIAPCILLIYTIVAPQLCLAESRLTLPVHHEKDAIEATLTVEPAERIAGIKAVFTYDARSVTFKEARKSEATASFLHVVNDRTPGRLVIVLASATGISAERVELCHLVFDLNDHQQPPPAPLIALEDIEIIDDLLNKIEISPPLPLYAPAID